MQTLFNYLPLLNALFCLGIGLYVLSSDRAGLKCWESQHRTSGGNHLCSAR